MVNASVVLVLCFAALIAQGSDSCTSCLSHEESLVVYTDYTSSEQYDLILEYGNQLCNRSFTQGESLRNCVTRAEQYARDRVKDLYADYEANERTVIINLDNMCEVLAACVASCCLSQWNPEQVHLSIGGDNSMIVMWVTQDELQFPSVAYWPSVPVTSNVVRIDYTNATVYTYDSLEWLGNIYTANLTDLTSLSIYNYQLCGTTDSGYTCFPTVYNFTAPPAPSADPLVDRFASSSLLPYIPGETASVVCLFGDISTGENGMEASASIIELRQNDTIQLVVQVGDLAYADGTMSIWDDYFRMIQDYAAYVPVMTSPGNHENYYNFVSYYVRLTMPVVASNSGSKQYYSFNYEKIHFISFSVEEDDGAGLLPGAPQRVWMENDLIQANKERDVRPWIILFGHRPIYCASISTDCDSVALRFREVLEDMLNQYHVDVIVTGHKHNYERTYPVYQSVETATNYVDPAAPVYYVVGTGGVEKNSKFIDPPPSWSAHNEDKYGYLFASAPDANTLHLDFLSKSLANVDDSATIQRTAPITSWTFPH